jgi:hypothetical protein
MMNEDLDTVQKLSYKTRVRIVWLTFIVVAVGLVFLIVQSIQGTIENAGDNLVTIQPSSNQPQSQIKYVAVERIERTDKLLKIYFNLNNPSTDIVNFSKLTDVRLRVENTTYNPQQITDRQGGVFVQKVLSRTQNFGILYFTPIQTDVAELSFTNLSLEKDPSNLVQQTLQLQFSELIKPTNVRQ